MTEQHHLALLFDTFTDRVGDRKPVFKYEQGLFIVDNGRDISEIGDIINDVINSRFTL